MSKMDTFDPILEGYLAELAELMESNLVDKRKHVARLMTAYPENNNEIDEAFETWENLKSIHVPAPGAEMDANFYKMLSTHANRVVEQPNKINTKIKWFNPRALAIAATFLIGLSIGSWLNFGDENTPLEGRTSEQSNVVSFASLELTPAASDRIREINVVKSQESLDMKIIKALNKVILHDPNINVRLTAIETMVLFSDIPEARRYLIEAIPYQQSSIVQLELADIMIGLEEKESSDEWQQLLESDQLESDVRSRLKENLKTLL